MLCLLVRIETRWRTRTVWVEACSAVPWSRRPPRPASSTLRLCLSSRTRARTRQSLGLASGGRAGRGWAAEVRGAESEPPPPPPPLLLPPPPPERSMSATRAKKVKMATKSCPECDQQVPVACKSCPCGYIFISRKLLNAKHPEKAPSSTEKQEKEIDIYANLSDEKAFVFSVALAEINRKIINQRLIL
ncbi:UPF0547 protein C16orf87 homolog isoform X2 [Ovis aries]|nr:UPF0547 protein C16orf87 homolog isoform X2 [Ovis aries]